MNAEGLYQILSTITHVYIVQHMLHCPNDHTLGLRLEFIIRQGDH